MKFKPGDKVAYSIQFLKSIGMNHSDMAHAKGVIKDLNLIIASIDWDDKEMPTKVNTARAFYGNYFRNK